MVHLKFERTHGKVVVNAVQEPHQDNLRVTLSTVTGLGHLGGLTDLDDDQERHNVALNLVET